MFLFSLTPPDLAPWAQWLWIVFASAAFIGGAVLRTILRRRTMPAFARAPWTRLGRLLTSSGLVLFVLLFFRVEGIPFFSARFWLAVLGVVDVAWLGFILRHAFVTVPKQRAAAVAEEQKRKYLR